MLWMLVQDWVTWQDCLLMAMVYKSVAWRHKKISRAKHGTVINSCLLNFTFCTISAVTFGLLRVCCLSVQSYKVVLSAA